MEASLTWDKLKSMLLLAGAFTFAFLLGEVTHEFGHYLTHRAYGHTLAKVYLDPFGGSRIVGVTSMSPHMMGVTSAAGPLFNLMLGLSSFSFIRRKHRPGLLPWSLWGPVAMIQEGVTFSLGLLTPGGDAAWITASGIPTFVVLIVGVCLLGGGVIATSWLLSLVVLDRKDPFWVKFLIVLVGTVFLMLIRALHAFLLAPHLVVENVIPLVFSVLLTVLVVLLNRPLAKIVNKMPEKQRAVPGSVIVSAMVLGGAMFLFQFIVSNLF